MAAGGVVLLCPVLPGDELGFGLFGDTPLFGAFGLMPLLGRPLGLTLPGDSDGLTPGGDEFDGGVVPGDVGDVGGEVIAPGADEDDGGDADGAAAGACAWAAAAAMPNAPTSRIECNLSISVYL